jgi:RHS repeat-associated protein
LAYDVNGRITKIERPDGCVATYSYDALGRRIAKTVRDQRTNYLWDGCCLAAEERESEITSQAFFYALEPAALWLGRQCVTPITDTSGAVREVLDDSGRIVWNCVLDTYGSVIREEGDLKVPFRFRGQYFDDEAGLAYNFHRTYDPQLGGYLSPDPIGLNGGSNFYAYPRNPLLWDDPFGLKCSKGHTAEERMDKHFQGKGYSKISVKGKSTMANGIDAIYYKAGGKPPYIIAESKAGSASLRWSGPRDPVTGKKTVQQMSDTWINNPPGASSTSRLESALPPVTGPNGQPQPNPHLTAIQGASQPGDVGKVVYTPSSGVVNNGDYLGQNSANNSF